MGLYQNLNKKKGGKFLAIMVDKEELENVIWV